MLCKAAAVLDPPWTHPDLAWAHPVVQEWFLRKFGSPTEPQTAGWPAILRGEPTLISAPTGSGKTLAAFLVCIDQLLRAALEGRLTPHTHVVYVSPLKALSNDVQKNLDGPLAEIQQLALTRGYLAPEIRTGVRTGDTLAKDRAGMLRHPPHILVTTPESLYILLTAGKSRQTLTRVGTVIVDEIHAVADDKRGSHLALTLERLDALVCGENTLNPGVSLAGLAHAPQRIGLSATQNPIELVGSFLTGQAPGRARATIVQVGQRRTLDLGIEIPSEELSSIASTSMWVELYDKLATLAGQHRSTLVFVNTRRLVEKLAFELTERLGPDAVAAHHGSLSRALRLDAEQRLKAGEIKILIATASLELGIDIGNVDLVCQINTTRAVAVAMQRVGRAGHWRGAVPKGRFFATTRDDLLEQAALVQKMRAGELDRLEIPEQAADVLMQQIVAAVGAESWKEDALFATVCRAWPYRDLTREHFDELVALLHNGIESTRGRYGAYLLRDRVHGELHARRGARMVAIGNGGAIPDSSLFAVMLQPENVQIATLDEHFAVDSHPGDVVLLGNTSWRIQRIDPQGKVLVEDAHGAPPSIPFWEGEAPQRTTELSDGVSSLRAEIDCRTRSVKPSDLRRLSELAEPSSITVGSTSSADPSDFCSGASGIRGSFASLRMTALGAGAAGAGAADVDAAGVERHDPTDPGGRPMPLTASSCDDWGREEFTGAPRAQLAETMRWLGDTCCICPSAARQLISYVVAGRAALGAVPTKTTIIAERFFDEGGGQQLILHAPFGGRLNKAWGLALRKRFCRGFNFELQAAATDNGINISLAEQHSFPLTDVFQFLTELTARELLEQASIPSPLFKNRWRWAAGRSLQLLRMQKGKRVAPQIQRSRSDDLLASVFPHASACPETMAGDIVIPDHPLVREVMRDTLTEAMDIDGLEEVLRGIASGAITCIAVDTPVPSLFAHELVNAMPYAFLDPEDAAARRTRAVSLRRALPDAVTEGAGLLDAAAIHTVREQLRPDPRDAHELHDLLLALVVLPVPWVQAQLQEHPRGTEHWPLFFEHLERQARAHCVEIPVRLAGAREATSVPAWIAAERVADALLLWPALKLPAGVEPIAPPSAATVLPGTEYRPEQPVLPRDAATTALAQGWLQLLGPATAEHLAALTELHPRSLQQALLAMEMQGLAMRGVFEHPKPPEDEPYAVEWCERRILQRIHRLTLGTLRKQVEPVSAATFNRWLQDWHHLIPKNASHAWEGEEGVLAAIEQLEGFEAPAAEWERTLLPRRVRDYDPRSLDNLCLAGVLAWGRISPHPAWADAEPNGAQGSRRVIPTSAAPITFWLRESASWLPQLLAAKCPDEATLAQTLSPAAQAIRKLLQERGAAFTADLQRDSGFGKLEVSTALWELAAAGLASADGFDQLRAMMDPRRKSVALEQTPAVSLRKRAAARTTAGRWSLLCERAGQAAPVDGPAAAGASRPSDGKARAEAQAAAIVAARAQDSALEAHARILLCRYGVLFRELLTRESNAPKWRDLAPVLRRLEARGEIRGGRFVAGAFGEQFALPEAVEGLRQSRRQSGARANEEPIAVAAADPLNLAGILVPGERVASVPGREVLFRNGAAVSADGEGASVPARTAVSSPARRSRSIAEIVRAEALPARASRTPTPLQGLFG